MESRYKLPSELQKKYLLKVDKISGLTGNKLAKLFGIVGRSYRDWKRGRYAITEKAVNIIEKQYHIRFPYSKRKAFSSWKKSKLDAARKGGVTTLIKYGSPGTPEGRSKGGRNSFMILRKRGIIPLSKPFIEPKGYSSDLAEFVGILLGDGHISKEQWSVTVNSVADKQYAEYVMNLVERLFKNRPGRFKKRNCNAIVMYAGGGLCIEYLQRLGLKVGNKVKQQVDVPVWIKTNLRWRSDCVRGLMDTDGGVFLHKYNVNSKTYVYKKICFSNRSLPLLHFMADTLQKLGLTPKVVDKVVNKKVWLYNTNEVGMYLKQVGTHNSRLLKYQ